ncbi:GNAT family N-acetyltransferase [Actinophytocola xinjiangensis]|uniref:GNAT family N-acetyltransferase n=1 Tax=Actinophytocola xinjiangensis TaxID=485602 RepID=A0A7Z1AVA8_9PSEU|nr:GNAT family N-acetyltransferase [Actinophytocola xinjiangensis]OLF05477.1 GNAT family N-acetyltransferase [Actinophytocola xinjiangensis]
MAEASVLPAQPSDAEEIARIQLDTWRTAYTDLLPPEVLDALDPAEAALTWRRTIEDGPARVFVAREGASVVGFCAAGPAPAEETASAAGEPAKDAATVTLVSTLLVEPRWGRRGHGGRLLAAAGDALRAEGSTRGIAWVPEADKASVSFLERASWVRDGTVRTLDAGGRPLREIRLTGTLRIELV